MSSENSAKRTIISKLSFFQQKDSKKLKTSDTDSVTEPPVTPDTKGKQKANDNNMEVDSATSVEPSSTVTKDTLVVTSATGLDASIHAPDKLNWVEETDKMMVDNTSTSTIPPTSSPTLTEKITAAVSSRDEKDSSTNQTASSQANKEQPPEEEVFIKVPKVTHFFATLSNVVLEGDTTSKQIAQIEHLLAQSNGFLGVRYSHYKKSFTLYYNTEYDLRKAAELLQSKFSQATVVIGNSKFDRQAEADRTVVVRDIPLFCNSETIKQYFAKFGDITRFSMTTTGMWQRAYVVYKDASTIRQLKSDVWSLDIMDFSVRVHALNLSKEDYGDREAYSLKLTGLPFDTTENDLR